MTAKLRQGGSILVLLAVIVGGSAAAEAAEQEPAGLFLTWQQDPTTTMTIDWHTEPGEREHAPVLHWKVVGEEEWHQAEGESLPFPHAPRTVHRVELTGLSPATSYRFRVGAFERAYKFRTMPERITEPLVFAVGGDTRHSQARMERTNRAAMQYDPEFVVWGGDLAYANGLPENVDRWYEWFDAIMNTMIDPEGRVVPVVLAIGNHEMRNNRPYRHYDDYEQIDEWRAEHAPFFYGLFAFPGQPGYDVLDFGEYLSLVLLDSGHSNPRDGEQSDWLERVLAERAGRVPHIMPVYHVPMFPSVRGSGEARSWLWRELFEQYSVRVAFENHDHAYKRTHPIRGDQIDPNSGIVYIGDGAWGVGTRQVHDPEQTWYLKRAESVRHAIIVTLQGSHQHFRVVSEAGEVIDEFPNLRDPEELDVFYSSEMTLHRASGNLVGAPLPEPGQWPVSQRGESQGEYELAEIEGQQVVKLHGLRYDGDRPRFRVPLAENLPNDQQLVATYSFRARANQPTLLRSRLHGSGGTITETQTHQLDTEWQHISYTERLSHDRPYTERLKFSPAPNEDYDGVEIYLDEVRVVSGVLEP